MKIILSRVCFPLLMFLCFSTPSHGAIITNLSIKTSLCLSASIPLEKCAKWTFGSGETLGFAYADVDADGDQDMGAGETGYSGNLPVSVYENNAGTLDSTAAWSSSETHVSRQVVWGDINGNGITTNQEWFSGNELKKLYKLEHSPVHQIISVTVDGTALDTDEYCANHKNGWVSLGDLPDRGIYNVAIEYAYSTNLDLVVSDPYANMFEDGYVSVYFDAGSGGDDVPDWELAEDNRYTEVALGDVDNDGDLDLAVANWSEGIEVYENLGGSLDTTPLWSVERAYCYSLAWGDMDGDGYQDLVTGHAYEEDAIFYNTGGALEESPTWESGIVDDTYHIALDDLDNDGRLDLVCANSDDPNTIYFLGTYDPDDEMGGTVTWEDDDATSAWWVDTADVDLDGDIDIAWANSDLYYAPTNTVFLNQGDGDFDTTPTWKPLAGKDSICGEWVDIDNDGDQDLTYEADGYVKLYEGRAVRHVPSEYSTIQAAINAAKTGQIVRVAAGTYYENLTMKEGVDLIGESASNTFIMGGSGSVIEAADKCVLSGFTISTTNRGGQTAGVWCEDGASPIIIHCVIKECGGTYGQGIYCGPDTAPFIVNNTIVTNEGYGGIGIDNASPTIMNNIIAYNYGQGGAGIYNYNGSPSISYNDVYRNARYSYKNCSAGTGGITSNPLFANTTYYLLSSISPCVDVGNPDDAHDDPDGTRNDMGALPY